MKKQYPSNCSLQNGFFAYISQLFSKSRVAIITAAIALLSASVAFSQVVVTNPSSPWTPPPSGTNMTIQIWGGGGSGGGTIESGGGGAQAAAGGGGGGAYATAVVVSNGLAYTITSSVTNGTGAYGSGALVGTAGNTAGNPGGTITFKNNVGTALCAAGGGGAGGGAADAGNGTGGTGGAVITGTGYAGGYGNSGNEASPNFLVRTRRWWSR